MADGTDAPGGTPVGRREFLGVGAVPIAAALAGSTGYQAQQGSRPATPPQGPRLPIRIGIIGAGDNVRDVMIPGFRRIPDCELLAVANTSLASSQRVATEFKIPRAYPHWKALLDDRGHRRGVHRDLALHAPPLTLASLERGKHVLCQARMANNAQEAREMLAASLRHPELVCQLVPTSTSYQVDNALKKLLADGYVGEVLSVESSGLVALSRISTADSTGATARSSAA